MHSANAECVAGAPADDANQTPGADEPKGSTLPPCPTEALVNAYHDALPALPRVVVLNDARKRLVSARWREVVAAERFDREQGLDWFRWFFAHVAASRFLTGRAGHSRDGRTFRADFPWLMAPTNFAKVVEGRYHDSTTTTTTTMKEQAT